MRGAESSTDKHTFKPFNHATQEGKLNLSVTGEYTDSPRGPHAQMQVEDAFLHTWQVIANVSIKSIQGLFMYTIYIDRYPLSS